MHCILAVPLAVLLLIKPHLQQSGLLETNQLYRILAMLQVLGEDLVLVAGQQDRLQRGGDVWGHPVAYDKLAVRYRRWRNSLTSADEKEKAAAAADVSESMSAGELFALQDSEDAVEGEGGIQAGSGVAAVIGAQQS